MAIKTSKYFLGSTGANYSIFDLEYALINYSENEISFKGGAAVDNVYVGNGFTFDFTESQGAIDKLYLKGASSDFNFAYDSQADVLTLTHKTVAGTIIRVSPDDTILFTDGSISALDITTHLPATGANLATNLLNSAERSPTNPNDLLVAQVSNNTLNAFALNGNGVTFAQVDPGVQLIVKGGNGVDLVYVSAGSQVTASDLGGGEDKIFLTGNWADYTKTYDSQADTVTLARTINGNTEQVIVAVGDRLVFADGNVSTDAAIAYAQDSVNNPVTLNTSETTPGLAITPAQLAALSDAQLAALTPAELAPLTAAHLDALTPAQITALGADAASLNPDTLASLDAAQVAALAPAAIAALSNEQLAALTPAQIAGLTPAQVDSLSPAQVGAIGSDIASLTPTAAASLDAAQQAAVLPANPAALSDAQLAALTPAQVTGLTAAQIDALTPAQITALGADAASLAPAALASLDAAQIAALTPAAIAALSNEQLAALTPAQVAGITAAQIDALSPAQIGAIGTDIASLTPAASASLDAAQQAAVLPAAPATLSDAQLAALTPAQIAGITAAQIDTLTPAQVTALGADAASLTPTALASLDAAQVAALTPAALAALSNDQLAALTPAQIAGITAAQIDALSPAQIGAIGSDISALNTAAAASLDAAQQAAIVPANPAALTDAQLAALSPAQVTGLTAAQIDTLTPAQITALGADAGSLAPAALASLDAAQIAALAPAAVAGLSDAKLAALTPAQVAAITAAQIDALTPAQVAALGSDLPSLSTAALASVDAAQIAAVAPATLAALSDAQLAALTPAQVAGLTAAQIDALSPAQVTALGADAASLSTAALASLDAAQVAALAPATVAALTDAQLAALTPAQVAGLTAAQVDALTPAQVAALGSDLPSLSTAALASVDAAQIAAVAPATVAALSDAQLAALTPAQVAGLTAAQIDALTPAQVAALGSDLPSLSTAALASVDAAQVAALAPATVAALTDAQLAALTPAQVAGLTAAQIDALTPAQVAALGSDLPSLSTAALASVDAAQLAAVAPATVAALTDAQLAALTPAQVAGLTAAQIDALTPAQVAALGIDAASLSTAAQASLDAAQVAALAPATLAALDNTELAALTPAQLANVTAAQIDSLTPAQITALGADVTALPVAALASFDAAQVAAITPLNALTDAQLTALTAAQLANVTAAQIDSLTPAQVAALGIDAASLSTAAQASLDAAQVAALAPATLAALDNTELAALTPAQLANVTAAQIDSLTPAQITALGADVNALPVAALASFDAAQVAAITPLSALSDAQLAALTPAQLANVTATQIDGLTAAQVTALGADLSSLPAAAIASINAAQAAGITATQLDTFDATDLGALAPAAIGGLTPAALASLDAAQFATLTPAQVAQITGTQVDTLSAAQIAALTVGQAAALNAGALASLDAAQQAALTIVANAVTVDPVAHTISGTLSTALAIGETVKVSLDGGSTWVDATATAGQTTFSLGNAGIDAANKAIQVKVVDTLNNSGAVFSETQFGEQGVSVVTGSNQSAPAITYLADGGWVVTWHDNRNAGSTGYDIYAIRYNSDGSLANGYAANGNVICNATLDQANAKVVASADGGFVVTWIDGRNGGDVNPDVYAIKYNADGTLASGFTANGVVVCNDATYQDRVSIATLADGGFVVSWYDQRNGSNDIYQQRYDASGNALLTANGVAVTTATGSQIYSSMTGLANGGWVISWYSDNTTETTDTDSTHIMAKIYDAAGNVVKTDYLVNTTTADSQLRPSVVSLENGEFIIAWESYRQGADTGGTGGTAVDLYMQRYSAAGVAIGSETLINVTNRPSAQQRVKFAALEDGGFVAVWDDDNTTLDGASYAVVMQRFNAQGNRVGSETLVNTSGAAAQSAPAITALNDGGWVITWHSNHGDGTTTDIYQQRYAADGSKLGDVTLTGTAGNDALTGNFADNNFTTSAGTDTIDGGGNGNNGDTLTAGTTGPVAIDLTGKNAGTVTDGANVTTFTNVENLTGTSSNADAIKPAAGHNVELSNIGTLNSIEKIDLTATGANTASLTAADVAEMSKAGLVANGAGGWSANSAISTTRDQVIVEGTNVDTLNLAGNWSNAGTITNGGNTYTLYNSRDVGSTAQLIVDADVAVNGNIVADSISLGAGKGYLVAPVSFADSTGAQQTWYVWSDNADGRANYIGFAGSTITDLVDDLGFVYTNDPNDYANETAPQTVTINGVTLSLGRNTNSGKNTGLDRNPDYEWSTFRQYADGDGNAATLINRTTLGNLDGWISDPASAYVGFWSSQSSDNPNEVFATGFHPVYTTQVANGASTDDGTPDLTTIQAAFQVTGTGVTSGATINPIATDNTITAAEMAVGVTITGTVAAGTTSVNLNFAGTNHAATLNGTTYTYTLQPADLTAMGTGNEIIAVRTNTGATATREITVGELASINPVQLGTAAYLGAAGSTTGSSISFAGDINGDGYEDFIVGAKSANSNAGAAYVVYGNANGIGASLTDGTIDSSKGFKITGPAASNLGLSVSGGGDFNGDGFSDMLVGTDGARNAYVVYGSATPTAVDLSAGTIASNQGYKIIGGAGSTLGVSLATSGDINGDGMDDMVVADVGSASNSWTGAVYVVYGSQTGATLDLSSGTINSSQGFKVTGGTGEYSVNAAGDVNGDGIADLIVGATGKGNVYVVYGTANNSGIDVSATTIPAGKGFTIDGIGTLGYSVAGVGDVNGDGYSDLAIGSYNNNSYTGVGYVVYGSANGTTVDLTSGNIAPAQGFQVNTGLAGSTLGRQVSAAGDVNGDGLADVIISAPDSFGSYVVYGSSTTSNLVLGSDGSIDSSRGFRLTGDNLSFTGWRVDGGGDLNGDGLDDLLITAAGTNSWAGGYHIVLGGQQFATTVDYLGDATANTLTGTATAETFVAGDGNDTLLGNGGADVMMGGKGNDTFTLNASNITALSSNMGAGGNTTQLATVDGGTGIDTLRVTGGANLDLTAISNTMEGSRIESVEKIDLATDTAANTLTIKLSDVLDMAGMNSFNNATGWVDGTYNLASGADAANAEKRHQVVVDGTAADTLTLQAGNGEWANAGTVTNAGQTYTVYNNTASAAQVLVDSDVTVNNYDSAFSLGAGNGYLIAPITVEGKTYYYWDRSGDGSRANVGSQNGGVDYTTHDALDAIFNKDINGVTGGGGNTTDVYRYATINGVQLALPTANGGLAYPTGTTFQNGSSASTGGTSSYDELLAIWDTNNGTGTGTNISGVPTDWFAGYYWSATPGTTDHVIVGLQNGYITNFSDGSDTSVALQLVSAPVAFNESFGDNTGALQTIVGANTAAAGNYYHSGATTDDTTPSFTGTVAAGIGASEIRMYEGETYLGNATFTPGQTTWSYTPTALSNGTHSLTAVAYNSTTHTGTSSAAFDVTVQTATVTSNDGTASGSNALSNYINQVTGTDIVSDAEFDAGFSITGHAAANATVKYAIDGNRTDGVDELGVFYGTMLTDASGNWTMNLSPNSGAVTQATHNTYGSGISKVTVWADTNGNNLVDTGEAAATRLFLVADGTATTADTGTVAQNYSVQDKVTGDVFVYYYGDPDGANGVGIWSRQDSGDTASNIGLVITDRDADAGGRADLDYYNTAGVALGTEATAANTALGMTTAVAAQTFEFHMGKPYDATGNGYGAGDFMVYGDAATFAGNHTTEGSNTSRLPTLDEVLGLYAANFGASAGGGVAGGAASTVGAVEAMTNTGSYNLYDAAEDNRPGGWTSLWSAGTSPSGHVDISLSGGHLNDAQNAGANYVSAVL